MSQGLQTLIEVGEADARVFELNLRLRRFPERLAEARRMLDIEQQQLDEVQGPWQQLDNEIQERESAIRIALETIDKFEEHMTRVTTQKEFMAARKQVDEARRLNARLQDEILERRVRQDELTPTLNERRERYNNVAESFHADEAKILAEQRTLEDEIAGLEETIESRLAALGGEFTARYHRLRQGKLHPAIVPVVSGSCSGCRMTLPPQVFNQLLASNGTLFTCPTCNRIIYHQPEEQQVDSTERHAAAAG